MLLVKNVQAEIQSNAQHVVQQLQNYILIRLLRHVKARVKKGMLKMAMNVQCACQIVPNVFRDSFNLRINAWSSVQQEPNFISSFLYVIMK